MSIRCIYINLPADKTVLATFLHAIAALPSGLVISAFRNQNLVATEDAGESDSPALTYTLLVPQNGVQLVLDSLLSCGIGDLSRRPGTQISIVAATDASMRAAAQPAQTVPTLQLAKVTESVTESEHTPTAADDQDAYNSAR